MFKYALKRVVRGYKLSLALTIGVLIATTFFASMIMSADLLSQEALADALEGIDYDAQIKANNITWSLDQFQEVEDILSNFTEVQSVDRYTSFNYLYNNSGPKFNVVGLERDSMIWQSLKHINGTTTLGANETYMVVSSVNATLFSIGDEISVPITVLTTESPFITKVTVNLTIAGFVEISENTARLLNPPKVSYIGPIEIESGDWRKYNIMLTDWESTVRPLIDWFDHQENVTLMAVSEGFLCRLNRDVVIDPYDVSASATNVDFTLAKIEDRTAAYNTQVTNIIGSTLRLLSFVSSILVLSYVSLAAPIIFMSWYSSTMLSDVSFNLRRREFGLLQTKGFGPKSINRMLQFEGIIVGLIGGTLGLFLGTGLSMVIANAGLDNLIGAVTGNSMNSVVVIVFGVIIALFSIRGPASRASKLEPLDALKQYVYIEEQREYRRLLPTIALVLGTYKIIVWILGINIISFMTGALRMNILILIIVSIWSVVDSLLNFIGPLLFLYGLTKILLRGSQNFQAGIIKYSQRLFGTFGKLATRNVQRNPMRNAALVFVVSLIVSYGVFSVGSLFSEQDRLDRTNLYEVGADVSAVFPVGTNVSTIVGDVAGISGVEHVTTEDWITLSTTIGTLDVRAINSSTWRDAAFYEDSWFAGATLDEIFQNFTGEKIILSIAVARSLELRIGNMITVRGPLGDSHQMEIVGIVGYPSVLEEFVGEYGYSGNYPSYVPVDFIRSAGLADYATPHVLVDTAPDVNGTKVEEEISTLYPDVEETDSFTSRVVEYSENNFLVAGMRSRWVGIAFAVALAVIGTGLVVGLTLKEKEYEVTLLGVRGFTRKQTLTVLFGEVMIMVFFSLILGVGTGLVQIFGDISNSSQNAITLIRPRIVFGFLPVMSMIAIILAVLIAALVPVIMATRFTEEKIDILRE